MQVFCRFIKQSVIQLRLKGFVFYNDKGRLVPPTEINVKRFGGSLVFSKAFNRFFLRHLRKVSAGVEIGCC